MHRKLKTIAKRGEEHFVRDITKLFEQRKAELLDQLKRLTKRQQEGWGYKRIMRRGYTVRAHKVRAHWVTMPVKRRVGRTTR